jgi:hypothetical protein
MNPKIEIYHYSCPNYDDHIDGVPQFLVLKEKPEGAFVGGEFIHLQCTGCSQKIAVRWTFGE